MKKLPLDQQTQVRVDIAMKRRVIKYIEQHEKKTHAKLGYGDAIRALLGIALDHEGVR